ncbi:flagellar basal-body MS-ring/collar protein FliF [Jannaschia ovalis]|uniref:Flagellar M-ring protein n=1 Tax=Jannaschia ovalis TaxID=3038773 RepID=A0ABY8LFW1_9RHOB|nr:flagellar basal-body MS-ring/collar protein FliF [Jannaschia sp. GRR-S6-38]WGH80166.1 flagellar basal-body MS-ring/collar protein FliF [Jannaschia sp. GRR-S6-38]
MFRLGIQNGSAPGGVKKLEKFNAFLQGQDKRRLAILALATAVAFFAILGLTRLATAPRMELLFARLEPAAAAEIVASLEASGTAFEVRGDSIFVDGRARDALRMRLAGEGLPRMDGAGYELLDGLSGFGTTSQMFDAAYWRAREGELTRTILAAPGVRMARVHLATADASPFARDRSATASVTLQMVSGAVGAGLARSVQSLVSGAVRDLAVEDVTVIDAASGRVVGGGEVDTEAEARDARLAEMRSAVQNLLEARVGPGRFVVELALETSRDRETITERVLDPDSRVVVSTDTEERSANDRGGPGVGVTVASNLPDGDAESGEGSESSNAETRERVNYDFSATQRQIEKPPGAVERLTVAVMVDGVRAVAEDGTATWDPREEAELETLRELVQSAVGFDAARGDIVTVRSMQFEQPAGPEAAPGLSLPWISGAQVTQLVTAVLLALVALGAMAFVVRPLLARVLTGSDAAAPAPALPAAAPAQADPAPNMLAPPEEIGAPPETTARLPDMASGGTDLPAMALLDMDSLAALPSEGGGDDPVERLRHLITERREETLEVLRGWMEQSPEDAR